MRIQCFAVIKLDSFPIEAFKSYSTEIDANKSIGVGIIAMVENNFKKSGDASKFAQSLHAFDFSQRRFLDKSKTWAQEDVQSDAIVIVTNVKDVEHISNMLRPATEIEQLAWEIRRGG